MDVPVVRDCIASHRESRNRARERPQNIYSCNKCNDLNIICGWVLGVQSNAFCLEFEHVSIETTTVARRNYSS